ncbi:insertion element protein [Tolypothrix sp. NIES-4075]|nr:insertion element protein [Tolypothrix sp. NIES-4075]GAX44309.1 insertion element protein [Tolypothrix sp. NIES-4075]GAX46107.1 insertion element protein [Tolypothrix sp. NIES-4075]
MYVNGMGFRAIERQTGVNHNTVMNWVKLVAAPLPDAPEYSEIPEIAQVDELETFVGKKKQNLVVDSRQQRKARYSSLGFRRP